MKYALQDKAQGNGGLWFCRWAAIGPSLTSKPEDRTLFADRISAMQSPAMSFSLTNFEVVEVEDDALGMDSP